MYKIIYFNIFFFEYLFNQNNYFTLYKKKN